MSSIHRTLTAAVGASLLLLLAACGGSGSDAGSDAAGGGDRLTITVGQQGSETEAAFVTSGAFDDAPYDVEYATFSSPTDTLSALASGKVDVGNNLAQWTATQGAAANATPWTAETAPYKNILVNTPANQEKFDRFVVAASAKSGITSIEQTKGKTWGLLPGTSGHLIAAKVLESQGWTYDDVKVVNLDTTNQVLALQTGQVDVLFNPRDNLVQAVSQGATILGESHDFGATIYTGYLANSKALDDPAKGKALEDFAQRLVKAQDWFVQNPEEAQAALVKYRKVTPEQAKTIWEFTRVNIGPPTKEILDASQDIADTATQYGLIDKKVDASVLFDDRFTDAIDATLDETGYADHLAASYDD